MASIYHNGDMIGSSLAIDDTQTSDKTTWSSEKIETLKVVVVKHPASGTFNSLPQTITNPAINANHVVLKSVLSNPAAQTGDWTVNTSAGQVQITGSISGSTNVTLYLSEQQ